MHFHLFWRFGGNILHRWKCYGDDIFILQVRNFGLAFMFLLLGQITSSKLELLFIAYVLPDHKLALSMLQIKRKNNYSF